MRCSAVVVLIITSGRGEFLYEYEYVYVYDDYGGGECVCNILFQLSPGGGLGE